MRLYLLVCIFQYFDIIPMKERKDPFPRRILVNAVSNVLVILPVISGSYEQLM